MKDSVYSLLAHCQSQFSHLMDLERKYDQVVTQHTPPESLFLSECQTPHVLWTGTVPKAAANAFSP